MKAILLAGGRGTRLKPFTSYVNKHLLPLLDKPVIQYAVEALRNAGIRDIAVVLGDFQCGDIVEFLGDGSKFGVKICYYYQGEAKGIAHAVNCARDFVLNTDEREFFVYLGDNIFSEGINPFVNSIGAKRSRLYGSKDQRPSCGLLFSQVDDPKRFGVPVFDFDGIGLDHPNPKLVRIEEKPEKPKSALALTGCYYFTAKFFDYFDELEPSARGEYEITDIINKMIERLNNPYWEIYKGWWSDAGTPESLWESARRLKEK